MTDQEQTEQEQSTETDLEPERGGLDAEDQTGKGYGQDEGERDQALEQ